jgi:pyruvate formate lyase activating enzyme
LFCSGALHTHIKFLPFKYAPNLIKYRLQPSDVIALAKKEGVDGILFGGNEPTVHLDFVLDVASLAKEAGFYVAMETNGYMTEEAIDLLAPVIDAVAIGLKGFADPEIHERWLLEQPVDPTYILNSIKAFYSRGVHTEVSVLPVPNYRDADTYARITSKWIATNVNSHIPVEIQAIFPYCISDWIESDNLTPSDVERFVSICRDAGLTHVYSRSFSHDNLLTYCSTCGEAVVRREVIDQKSRYLVKSAISAYDKPIYTVELVGLKIVDGKGYCANCNTEIYGVWA